MLDLRTVPQELPRKPIPVGGNNRDLFVAIHLMSTRFSVIRLLCNIYYLFGGRHAKNADWLDGVDVLRGVTYHYINGDWIVSYLSDMETPRNQRRKPSVSWRTFLWR